jgi:hypothetical protein
VPAVAWISFAPVKGLALVQADEVFLGRDGVADNRRFCIIDANGRRYGALRDGRLQAIGARWEPDARRLELRFPDGSVAAGADEPGDWVTTDLHDDDLHARVVRGPWAEALSRYAGRPLRLVEAEGPTRGVDRPHGPVTLVSEASLEALALSAGVDAVDGRRFRMLFGLGGCVAHEEDTWLGRDVRLGEAVVRLTEQVARCAITTQNPETGAVDFDTLREIRAYRGFRNETGKHIDFGVFGTVAQPGRVSVGDPVEAL